MTDKTKKTSKNVNSYIDLLRGLFIFSTHAAMVTLRWAAAGLPVGRAGLGCSVASAELKPIAMSGNEGASERHLTRLWLMVATIRLADLPLPPPASLGLYPQRQRWRRTAPGLGQRRQYRRPKWSTPRLAYAACTSMK